MPASRLRLFFHVRLGHLSRCPRTWCTGLGACMGRPLRPSSSPGVFNFVGTVAFSSTLETMYLPNCHHVPLVMICKQVLPGYPTLRPGLLTHYTKRSTWAPKEFRRERSTGDEVKPTAESREPEAPAADGFETVSPTAIDVGDIRDDTTGQTWQACRLLVLSVRSVAPGPCPDAPCTPRFVPSGSPETAGQAGTSSSSKPKSSFGNMGEEVSVPPSITDDAVLYGEIGVDPDGTEGTPPQGLGGSQTLTRALGEASSGLGGLGNPITVLDGCSSRGSRNVRCFREVEVMQLDSNEYAPPEELKMEGKLSFHVFGPPSL